jgi:hypothetical protein
VDWAAYLSVAFNELEVSGKRGPYVDDLDAVLRPFVGSVRGAWGQRAYGVHAEPVAALLGEC